MWLMRILLCHFKLLFSKMSRMCFWYQRRKLFSWTCFRKSSFVISIFLELEAKFEIPEDPIPVKIEPLEDMCLISISHDDYTIIQELTEDSVNEDFIQNVWKICRQACHRLTIGRRTSNLIRKMVLSPPYLVVNCQFSVFRPFLQSLFS